MDSLLGEPQDIIERHMARSGATGALLGIAAYVRKRPDLTSEEMKEVCRSLVREADKYQAEIAAIDARRRF